MNCYTLVDPVVVFFFFNDTATTEIYTLSLHDALPIFQPGIGTWNPALGRSTIAGGSRSRATCLSRNLRLSPFTLKLLRSEEHTSELQSRQYLVCRLLLEKKQLGYRQRHRQPDQRLATR